MGNPGYSGEYGIQNKDKVSAPGPGHFSRSKHDSRLYLVLKLSQSSYREKDKEAWESVFLYTELPGQLLIMVLSKKKILLQSNQPH